MTAGQINMNEARRRKCWGRGAQTQDTLCFPPNSRERFQPRAPGTRSQDTRCSIVLPRQRRAWGYLLPRRRLRESGGDEVVLVAAFLKPSRATGRPLAKILGFPQTASYSFFAD